MKKILVIPTIIIATTIAFIAGKATVNNDEAHLYALSTVVTSTNGNEVIVRDFSGNLWKFTDDDSNDWTVNDICSIIMNDNGTEENIFDDVIMSVRYSGYIK